MVGYVKRMDENSILRRAIELEVVRKRPVGRPNITEDMAEDRQQWRRLISRPTPGVGN